MKWFWFAFLICLVILGFSYQSFSQSQTLDTHMTEEEAESTGVNHLTPEEKEALQQWINENHYVKPGAKTKGQRMPTVSEVLGDGHYLKLSDNSIWQVHPQDTPITSGWITAANIKVSTSNNADYPYLLTNQLTGSSIRAQRIKALPPEAPPPAPAAPVKKG